MTNSNVSRALANLRVMFDDELFTRTANGFVPTDLANELAESIGEVVALLRNIDKQHTKFDPRNSEGSFEIRVYDEFSFAVQDVIENVILKLAPKMRFNVRILTDDCTAELVNGKVDFAIVYEGYDDKRLNFDCFARTGDIYLLMRNNHPLKAMETFTAKDLAQYPLLEIDNYRDLARPLLVDICHEKNCSMRVANYTESVASAFQLISRSDCITVMCNQFTRQFADMFPGITYVRLPDPILKRIKEKRSEIKPIGNYIAYGNTNRSRVFQWVKHELFVGLRNAWIKASEN